MNAGPIRYLAVPILAFVLGVGLFSCGGDAESPTSTVPLPDFANRYAGTWTLHLLRKSDGFQKQFECAGSLTLVQDAATGSTAGVSGFAVIDNTGCVPESHDLTGRVSANGAIEFTMDGPRPPEGPCPGGKDVHFTGQVSSTLGWWDLHVRGETNVTCPELGEHTLTYVISTTGVGSTH